MQAHDWQAEFPRLASEIPANGKRKKCDWQEKLSGKAKQAI